MPNPTRLEVCCDDKCPNFGLQQEVEVTEAEVAEMQAMTAQAEAERAALEAEEAAKAEAKASADAKLTAFYESIGLTAEEIAAKL